MEVAEQLEEVQTETTETQTEEAEQVETFSVDNWTDAPNEVEVAEEVAEVQEAVVEEAAEVAAAVEEPKETIVEKIVEQKPTFANENSQRVYELLQEGKNSEVLAIMNEQEKLSNLDKFTPSEIIKLNLEYENKKNGFTKEDIQDLFEEKYSYPEKPVQAIDEDDDEFAERQGKYESKVSKIDSRISREAKLATQELEKHKQAIELPNLNNTAKEPTQEELELEASNKAAFFKQLNDKTSTFNGYNVDFKDEEVELNLSLPISKEQKEKVSELAKLAYDDAGGLLKGIGWLNSEGGMDISKIIEDLPLLLNRKEILEGMVSEAANERYKAAKKNLKNSDLSGKKRSTAVEPTLEENAKDFDKAFLNM